MVAKINRLWNCDECGNMTENPNMNVNLQVVVKCPGLRRLVNVKLHQTCLSKLIPIKKIKNAFLMDDIELRKDQVWLEYNILQETKTKSALIFLNLKIDIRLFGRSRNANRSVILFCGRF